MGLGAYPSAGGAAGEFPGIVVASGFSAPAILAADKFTRLAQVTGDADCDRPLTFSSDV